MSRHCATVFALTDTPLDLQAFEYPPFRWLFITNVLNCCYSTIATLFYIFWFQDEVGGCGDGSNAILTAKSDGSGSASGCVREFELLGVFKSNSPRTALAVTTTVSTVCSFIFVLPGGWLADYFVEDRALVMLVGALLQTTCPCVRYLYILVVRAS
jgi:hypothetical protein